MHVIYVALETGFLAGAVYGLMASGMALIYGVTRVVNVAQGGVALLGAYLSYSLAQNLHVDPFLSLIAVIPIAFVFGAAVYVVLIRRMRAGTLMRAVLITAAIAFILQGAFETAFGTQLVTINASYVTATFAVRHDYIPYVYLFGFLLSVALLAALYVFLYRTRLGRLVRLTAQSRGAARVAGVDLRRIDALVFGIGFAFAAAGGTVYGTISPFNPVSSYDLITRLLAIVLIAGLGSIPGAVIVAIVLMMIQNVTQIYAPVGATAVFYVALALSLIVRPRGILDWNRWLAGLRARLETIVPLPSPQTRQRNNASSTR